MKPRLDIPSRALTGQECFLHTLMETFARDGDIASAQAVRDQLPALSARRSEAALRERGA